MTDSYGVPHTIKFMRPTNVPIKVWRFTPKALSGYTLNIGAKIKASLAAYINSLNIGDEVYLDPPVRAGNPLGEPMGSPTTSRPSDCPR